MNKVILIGRAVRNAELKRTASGKNVVQFALAVDKGIPKSKQQDGQPTADFIDCVAWERNADFAAKYLTKGLKILVEGRLGSRSYKDQQGNSRKVTEVVVDKFEFVESKPFQGAAHAQAQQDNFGGFGSAINDDDIF